MAMTKCAECGKEISDQAVACPGCGAPVQGVAPVARAGAKYEATGFVLISIGLVAMLAGASWGIVMLLTGFVVFVIGRLK